MKWLPNPVNLPLNGVVDAAGDLRLRFGPQFNQAWEVSQISIEMTNAPVGAICDIFYMTSFVTRANSARVATAGGDPPVYLQPGEEMSVIWRNSTPGLAGKILVIYRKGVF